MERLQKVIANLGYTSRRKAEELILKGKVKVNGEIIKELGIKVNTSDLIEIEGTVLEHQEKVYFLLNKPRGVITSVVDDKNRKTVVDLIKTNKRIYPVGRLDYDTTGAIILTNDGELANLLMHPKNEIDKVYIAKVKGLIGKKEILKLTNGVYINGIKTSKGKARILKYDKKSDTSIVELTIHEGKNHQVKNMFKVLGYDVIKLKRESIAFLSVKNIKSGDYIELKPKEVKKLYNFSNN